MDTENTSFVDWVAKELEIDPKNNDKLERILSYCNIKSPPGTNEKLIIRWGEYCGNDKRLAMLIENLHRKIETEEEFKWKAYEVSWWWKNFFSCPHMVDIQVMSQPLGLIYWHEYVGPNREELHLKHQALQVKTRKFDSVWQDYMNVVIENEIIKNSEESDEVTSLKELEAYVKNLLDGDYEVNIMFKDKGVFDDSFYRRQDFIAESETLMDKRVVSKPSTQLNPDEYVISASYKKFKPKLIWAPYTLGQSVNVLNGNRFKYMYRGDFFVKPEKSCFYKKFKLTI